MASDNDVVSNEHQDRPNPLRRKPPVPPKEVPTDPTPVFSQLVAELGHDPLDSNDKSYDDFRTASQMWTEAHQELHYLTQELTNEEVPGN